MGKGDEEAGVVGAEMLGYVRFTVYRLFLLTLVANQMQWPA